ncbi:MAG: LemA family protein [Mogibacterium sp.]|nr:LemA family protein [Mogibacterium sp.]
MIYLLVIIVIAALVVLVSYNSLVKEKNRVETAEVELAKYMENGTAEDIDNAKKYYNAVVRDYNNKVEGFPTSLVADMFNFPVIHTEEFDEGL